MVGVLCIKIDIMVNELKHCCELIIFTPPCNFVDYTRRFHYEALANFVKVVIMPMPSGIIQFLRLRNLKKYYKNNFLDLTVLQNFCLLKIARSSTSLLYFVQKFFLERKLLCFIKDENSFVGFTTGSQGFYKFFRDILKKRKIKFFFDLTDAHWLSDQLCLSDKLFFLNQINEILLECSAVFCSSKRLVEYAKNFNSKVFYLPNTTEIVSNITYKPWGSVLKFGFIGNINEWIDLDLVFNLSKIISNGSIVFVGDLNGHKAFNERFREFVNNNIIQHLPRIPMNNIFQQIQEFDVCLIPYVQGGYQSFIFPNKLIQYLACGKVVLSTNFAIDLEEFRETILLANTVEEFLDFGKKIKNYEINYSKEIFDSLRNIALANSSTARAKKRLEFLLNL